MFDDLGHAEPKDRTTTMTTTPSLLWIARFAAPFLLLISLIAWGFSSPIASAPDDDFHLASIWCGGGDRPGLCEPGSTSTHREVPRGLLEASCYALHPDETAGCQTNLESAHETALVDTDRGNFAGGYPPVFYAFMSLFASHDLVRSALLMRVVNAVLFVALATTSFALAPVRRRASLVVPIAVTLVPLGLSLIPSTNPSSWAIAAAGTLWMSMLGFFESTGKRRLALGVLSSVAVVMGAGARADAALYAILAIVAAIVLGARKREFWTPRNLWLPVVLCAASVVLYVSAGQGASVLGGLGADDDHLTAVQLLVSNLLNLPNLLVGGQGTWNIGWLDTSMPSVVWVAMTMVVGGMVLAGIRTGTWQKYVLTAGATLVLIALPLYVLQIGHIEVGHQVQPRYVLPVLIVVVGLAALQRADEQLFSLPQLVVAFGATGIANAVALYTNLKRYVMGSNFRGLDIDHNVGWWWSFGVPAPLVVLAIGSLAFFGTLAAAIVLLRAQQQPALRADTAQEAFGH